MRFHFSCTRNPHTEREVYTMRTPRLRLLSAILAVVLFFTLLPVSALAEGDGSNANTGLTISIVGGFNNWDPSNITMKEVSPAVYEVTIENTSYYKINDSPGFKLSLLPAEPPMLSITMMFRPLPSAPALMLKIPSITLLSALI